MAKVLSVRQPWAWAIVQGYKPVENRTWRTSYRGLLYVHAGKVEERSSLDYVTAMIAKQAGVARGEILERYIGGSALGAIVGVCELVGCVRHHESPWFEGPWGLVLANAKPLDPFECKGQLGLFELPADASWPAIAMSTPR